MALVTLAGGPFGGWYYFGPKDAYYGGMVCPLLSLVCGTEEIAIDSLNGPRYIPSVAPSDLWAPSLSGP